MAEYVSALQATEVALRGAILLYGPDLGQFTYATAHTVDIGLDGSGPVIGPGTPINRRALIDAVRHVAEASLPKGEFLTPNVLSIGPTAVTWWCAPAHRRVFFRCKELGERSAVVPHPGLVFRASTAGFRVFALAGEARPSPDAALFEPPYFNTWDRGSICIGSAMVPREIDVASIPGWEGGFFDSAFTHPNQGGPRISYGDGFYAFWRDILEGKFDDFPRDALVPMNFTLADLIAGNLEK
ncbi:PRTRC system protein B [Cupriavidus sp. AU9028]|uniref:PRTRC system protein B n=1 Tax=Cupriavidus sp. AU9028 TaxID=2871157 RepID=UPI001C956163|nr:PRTRC system protein B [Cupriavidus sp. AU9028]MBY4898684.1 PRTRC system protein B [Cupriavidus sp. AU9028]